MSYFVLDDGSFHAITRPEVVKGTLLEGAAGVKSTVNDLLYLYLRFMLASNVQEKTNTTSSKLSRFRQCPTLVKAHNFLDESGSPNADTYGLGLVRCRLPGVLGRMGINAKLQMDLPRLGSEASSLHCLYHEGTIPGSLSNVYLFPETTAAIVTLQIGVSLNDTPSWISQLFNRDHL